MYGSALVKLKRVSQTHFLDENPEIDWSPRHKMGGQRKTAGIDYGT